jgi:hypothetical protein
MKYLRLLFKPLIFFPFLVSAFFAGRLFEQWNRLAVPAMTQATTTPTPYVPLLPEGGAYVKCVEFYDGYHIECYPGEVYHKTTGALRNSYEEASRGLHCGRVARQDSPQQPTYGGAPDGHGSHYLL